MDEQPEAVHVEVVVSPEVGAEAATLFDDPIDTQQRPMPSLPTSVTTFSSAMSAAGQRVS
jgi:hypothetical protein